MGGSFVVFVLELVDEHVETRTVLLNQESKATRRVCPIQCQTSGAPRPVPFVVGNSWHQKTRPHIPQPSLSTMSEQIAAVQRSDEFAEVSHSVPTPYHLTPHATSGSRPLPHRELLRRLVLLRVLESLASPLLVNSCFSSCQVSTVSSSHSVGGADSCHGISEGRIGRQG